MMPVETICRALQGVRESQVMHIAGLEQADVILTAYRDVALMADRLFPPKALCVAFEAALSLAGDARLARVRVVCAQLIDLAESTDDAELRVFYDVINRTLRREFSL